MKIKIENIENRDEVEGIGERFFAEVMEEMKKGFKDAGINGKAIALSGGDDAKANAIYVELRAKALQEKYFEELRKRNPEEVEHINPREKNENIKAFFIGVMHFFISLVIALIGFRCSCETCLENLFHTFMKI